MSEKEHSVDFLMIKLLHVYATKIFHQLSHVNLHPGQMPMLDILYRQEDLLYPLMQSALNLLRCVLIRFSADL